METGCFFFGVGQKRSDPNGGLIISPFSESRDGNLAGVEEDDRDSVGYAGGINCSTFTRAGGHPAPICRRMKCRPASRVPIARPAALPFDAGGPLRYAGARSR